MFEKKTNNGELMQEDAQKIFTPATLINVAGRYYTAKVLGPIKFNINNFSPTLTDHNLEIKDSLSGDCQYSDIPDSFGEFSDDIAYLYAGMFFLYHGELSKFSVDEIEWGIYKVSDAKYILIYPREHEIEFSKYENKILNSDADEIREAVLNKTIVIFNTPDSAHSSIPEESLEDDILKRLIKRAIHQKGIDLDRYKVRFASKNMLFNAKQVLRGDGKLSMLIFDRCAEALNLKYTIIFEENGGDVIGVPLENAIVISSSDVEDNNIRKAEDA